VDGGVGGHVGGAVQRWPLVVDGDRERVQIAGNKRDPAYN